MAYHYLMLGAVPKDRYIAGFDTETSAGMVHEPRSQYQETLAHAFNAIMPATPYNPESNTKCNIVI